MNKENLVSVIIPVYKVEQYLEKCIDSIINQSYKNIEIILVDDGSPDNCGKICDYYKKRDKRITVIHKENGGLSEARNYGLKVASGDYIVFVDSDDIMEIKGISVLYTLLKKYDADIVIGGVERFNDENNSIILETKNILYKNNIVLSREEAIKEFFINGCASWARIYKKSLFNDVEFPVGEINEDEAIILNLLNKCNVVVKTDQIVYRYRFRPDSITSSKWTIQKQDWCEHCKFNLLFIHNNYPQLEKYAMARYRSSLIWALNNISENLNEFSDLVSKYKCELKNITKQKDWDFNLTCKEKIRVYCLIYCFNFYSMLVKVLGKHFT